MRLLFVARRFPPDSLSGRSLAFARLVDEARRHAEVRLVAGWTHHRSAIPDDALGVDSRMGALVAHLRMLRAIGQSVRRFRPDVIIAASPDVPYVPWPSVLVARDLVDTGWERREGWSDALDRRRMRRWSRVVAPTQATRDELVGAGVSRWAVERIPEGWGDWSEPVPRPNGARLIVVQAGRIHPGKGAHLAIDAVSRLHPDEKARVLLRVVGPVTDRRYLDQLREAAAGQPVELEPEGEARAALDAADLALYPTCVPEGFADGVVEAHARSRAVIWSDHPGVRETAAGGGLAVPPGDVGALREALRRALRGELPLDRLGLEGRAIARARYDWAAVWPRWEELLGTLTR